MSIKVTLAEYQITQTVQGIMKALSSAQQSEVKAWEEEILACEHTLTLQQEPVINVGEGAESHLDANI